MEYKRRSGGSRCTITDAAEQVKPSVRKDIEKYAEQAKQREDELREVSRRLDELSARVELPKFVRNRDSGVLHRANGMVGWESLRGDPMFTLCGWNYHSGNSELLKEIPSECKYTLICSRCLPEARLAA